VHLPAPATCCSDGPPRRSAACPAIGRAGPAGAQQCGHRRGPGAHASGPECPVTRGGRRGAVGPTRPLAVSLPRPLSASVGAVPPRRVPAASETRALALARGWHVGNGPELRVPHRLPGLARPPSLRSKGSTEAARVRTGCPQGGRVPFGWFYP
jgi:hypothetical protein